MPLTKCKECGKEVSKKADKCPHCGAPLVARRYGCGTLIVFLFLVFILVTLFSPDRTSNRGNNGAARSASSQPSVTESARQTYSTPLEVLSFRCRREYSYISVSGEVRNISNQKMDDVLAVGLFRASDGSLVKSDDSLIDYNPILAGQTSPFEVTVTDNPEISSCNISFKFLFGGAIGFTNAEGRIREAQELLTNLGYDPGSIDGVMGPETRAAISAFQEKKGLSQTDRVDERLLQELRTAGQR